MKTRNIPAPYTMCRKEECQARQSSGEVSIFERAPIASAVEQSRSHSSSLQAALERSSSSTQITHKKKEQFVIDPRLAVSKYRRSAAGVTERYTPRTLDQLLVTVQYLQELLIEAPGKSSNGVTSIETYLSVVEFVQDRFRAVQVDLTRSQQVSKRIQLSMIRSQILILYLMADVPAYSTKLGKDALKAALSNYWMGGNENTETHRDWDDEVLAYTFLLQACCGETLSIWEIYRNKYQQSGTLFKWSLRLVEEWAQGHWFIVLKLLRQGSCQGEFNVFARCCLASQLSYVRWKALEAYNVTWGKAEAVRVDDVSRLLFLKDATSFCQACGLPLTEMGDSVVFKSVPLTKLDAVSPTRDDDFVLGVSDGLSRSVPLGKISINLPSVDWMKNLFCL